MSKTNKLKLVEEYEQKTYNFKIKHPKYGVVKYSYQIDINGEYMDEKILFEDYTKKIDKNAVDGYNDYYLLEDELRSFVEKHKYGELYDESDSE